MKTMWLDTKQLGYKSIATPDNEQYIGPAIELTQVEIRELYQDQLTDKTSMHRFFIISFNNDKQTALTIAVDLDKITMFYYTLNSNYCFNVLKKVMDRVKNETNLA